MDKVACDVALNVFGARVPVERAIRGLLYHCEICADVLIPKRGRIKQYHYAHKTIQVCSGMTQEHIKACELAASWLVAGNYIRMYMMKRYANDDYLFVDSDLFRVPVYDRVSFEHRLGNSRLDVAFLNGDTVVLNVEVYHTHKTDNYADRSLIPWIEIRADDLLNQRRFFVTQSNVFKNVLVRELKVLSPKPVKPLPSTIKADLEFLRTIALRKRDDLPRVPYPDWDVNNPASFHDWLRRRDEVRQLRLQADTTRG